MFKRFLFKLLLLLAFSPAMGVSGTMPLVKNSLFATGQWIKIETSSPGLHKINFSWLRNIGFSHPENVRIYGSRNERISLSNIISDDNAPVQIPAMKIVGSGGNDFLLFYVQGPIKWVFDPIVGQYRPVVNQAARGKSWYFLTENSGVEAAFPQRTQTNVNPDVKVTEYDDLALWGDENINLLESGTRWFSDQMSGGNQLNRIFQFQDRFPQDPVQLNVYAVGRSIASTTMDVAVNGNLSGNLHFYPIVPAPERDFASPDSVRIVRIQTGEDVSVNLKFNGSSGDLCWFDYATVQVRRTLFYRGKPLVFRDSRNPGKYAEYQINGVITGLQLWDITNPLQPAQMTFQSVGSTLIFRASSDPSRRYILFDPTAQYPEFTVTEEVKNTDLLHLEVPALLILTPSAFLSQANRLADFHRSFDGMAANVATVETIFNEFSGGYPDVAALRNFVRYLYNQKSGTNVSGLKYLLLFGKGTFDMVHDTNENNPNLIPSFQSENSLNGINSYVSDDYFGLFGSEMGDPSGNIDLGIGRIPVATIAEATAAVDKIFHYHDTRSLGEWRNNITFIGDDEDNNIHVNDSEKLATSVNKDHPEYKTSKIYLDAFPQVMTPEERYPDVNEAIRRSVQSGDLIVNYVGHASEDGLAHERVLTINDIDSWTNKDKLPLFVTATCDFSRWDMTVKRSAGEHLFFNPSGGAIALLSATRLVYSASNFDVNKSFFNHVFEKDDQGKALRLGDLIRLVKNENKGSVNTLKFCLLGDPALRLNYPEYGCKTLEINKQPISNFSGIVSPLSLVTVTGEIQDARGAQMNSFSGSITATVYDQPSVRKTLGNAGLAPFTYAVQDNILFNGIVPVTKGSYSLTFVVPKDVDFGRESGLIRYYFTNGSMDGNGSYANIYFNGTENLASTDNKGPEIRLFLENDQFRDGGTVSSNPLLLAYLIDESGINTSGIGIGHDIVMELDGQSMDPIILNDFFQTDQGTWKSGTLTYPIGLQSDGMHTLKLKVWDNANNSSTYKVEFNVSKELKINNLISYPNPFSDQTRWVITHNRYGEKLDVHLEITDLMGRKVFEIKQSSVSGGYKIDDLYWFPGKETVDPGNGMYIYRITLKVMDGSSASGGGILVRKK
ncbi:MAG: type IX secretion system sortase PorU [Prolixibacteraceae bacterium]